jgi:hypothetical protein
VSEELSPPEFHIDAAAARHAAENGGRVYIWLQPFGGSFDTLKTSLDEPSLDDTAFIRYQPDEGLEVYVDETIPPPGEWWLSYHRFPRRHIRADYPRKTEGASADSGSLGN